MGATKKMFLVTILIGTNEWDYKKDQQIVIPVITNNKKNAITKITDKYVGSEYPDYDVVDVKETDDFLFKPML